MTNQLFKCNTIQLQKEANFFIPSLSTYYWKLVSGFSIGIRLGGKIVGVGGEWTTRTEGAKFWGGPGVCSQGKFWKFGTLRMHFLHSGVFERKMKHKSPLKLLRMYARFFCFSWINLGRSKARVLWRMFLMLVVKYEVISQLNRRWVHVE